MTEYRDAVKALASSITSSDRGLSDEEKIEIARSILSRGTPPGEDIEIDVSEEKDFQILRDYLGEIQRARSAELGKDIQASVDNAKRLSSLRDELKQDISRAYDEDIELESIASKLQDKDLGEIAGREEDQINDLGARLEELAVKAKKVDRLEQALENMMDEHGLKTDELTDELGRRADKVSRLVESHVEASDNGSDSGPDISEPWQLVAKDPSNEPDWTKNSTNIWKDDWSWKHTTPRGSAYNWMVNSGPKANQGWKIHVAVNPDDEKEVLQVAKAIIPVLESIDSSSKFARSAEGTHGGLKNKGGETRVKLATIYPKQDGSPSNPSEKVNQNNKTTEKIVTGLVSALSSEGVLGLTNGVNTVGEFNVEVGGTTTRIFLRYEPISKDFVEDVDGNKLDSVAGASDGRKPGALPESFESRTGVDLSGKDVREMKGLKYPSLDLVLPTSNYNHT